VSAAAAARYIGSPRLRGCCHTPSQLKREAFGTYRDVIQPSGQTPIALYGRLLAVLERDRTGAWRISRLVVIRDSSNAPDGRPR
jgi:hypothetical protein